jgi:hypothetical protein
MVKMDDDRARRYASWQEGFARASVENLIKSFNREVGNNGWGTARADYLHALRAAFEACGYDCSGFISREDGSMSFRYPLAFEGGRIVQRRQSTGA